MCSHVVFRELCRLPNTPWAPLSPFKDGHWMGRDGGVGFITIRKPWRNDNQVTWTAGAAAAGGGRFFPSGLDLDTTRSRE